MHRWTTALLVTFSLSILAAAQSTSHSTRMQSGADALQLRDGWSLQSSYKVEQKGEVISSPRFTPAGW